MFKKKIFLSIYYIFFFKIDPNGYLTLPHWYYNSSTLDSILPEDACTQYKFSRQNGFSTDFFKSDFFSPFPGNHDLNKSYFFES